MKAVLPRFRLLDPAYLRPARHSAASKFEAGAEVDLELDAVPSASMIPMNAPARAMTAALIRSRGLARLRNPAAGDRRMLVALNASIGGHPGTVEAMAAHLETFLATQDKDPKS